MEKKVHSTQTIPVKRMKLSIININNQKLNAMETNHVNQTEISATQNEELQYSTQENECNFENQNLDVNSEKTDDAASEGTTNMFVGALWCIGGIVVTAVTYSAAQEGGTFVIAWGAIVFGAWQFLKGFVQSFK
jgi:hypothetical protein